MALEDGVSGIVEEKFEFDEELEFPDKAGLKLGYDGGGGQRGASWRPVDEED